MEMREKILLGALAAIGAATPAYAQTTGPSFEGSISSTTSTSTATCGLTTGCTTTATTGDSTVSPFISTFTSTQNIVLNTSGTGSTGGTVTFNGDTFGYGISGSGTGSQPQQITTTIVNTYNTSSTTVGTVTSVAGPTNTPGSTATVSSLSVSGSSGFASESGTVIYGGTLSSAETLNSDGSVNVTENTIGVTTSGTTYTTYTGTASFAPSTGVITVGPLAQQSQTSIGSTGLTTTGSVNAATVNASTVNAGTANIGSITMVGGEEGGDRKIHNLAAGTATGDAVNVGQLNTAIAGVTTSINSLATLVEANRKRSDAGIATAVALSGASFLPGKKINITANVGAFRDEVAIAGQIGVLVSDNVALNAGVSTSLHSYGGTSVRGGVTFGF